MKYSLKIAPPIGLFSERISFEHSPDDVGGDDNDDDDNDNHTSYIMPIVYMSLKTAKVCPTYFTVW